MKTTLLVVPDILCRQCEEILARALSPVEGVADVHVDIPKQQVEVLHVDAVTPQQLQEAVEEEDYFVSEIRPGAADSSKSGA